MKLLLSLFFGTVFGTGLAISGMTDTQKVLNFLDLPGEWDASLGFVMAAGLLVTIPAFYLIIRQKKPVLAEAFNLPASNVIDVRLIVGGILFGVGWGLYGYCPGPAISALTYLDQENVLFVLSMMVGMFSAGRLMSN